MATPLSARPLETITDDISDYKQILIDSVGIVLKNRDEKDLLNSDLDNLAETYKIYCRLINRAMELCGQEKIYKEEN